MRRDGREFVVDLEPHSGIIALDICAQMLEQVVKSRVPRLTRLILLALLQGQDAGTAG